MKKVVIAVLIALIFIIGSTKTSIAATNNDSIDKAIIQLEKMAESIISQETKLTKLSTSTLSNFEKGIVNVEKQIKTVKSKEIRDKFIQRTNKLKVVQLTATAYNNAFLKGESLNKLAVSVKTGYDKNQTTQSLINTYNQFVSTQKQYNQELVKIKDKALQTKLDGKFGKVAKQKVVNAEPYVKALVLLLKVEKDLNSDSLSFYDSYQAYFNAKQKLNKDKAHYGILEQYYNKIFEKNFAGKYKGIVESVTKTFEHLEYNYNNRLEESLNAFYFENDQEYRRNLLVYKKIWDEGWKIDFHAIKVYPLTPDYSFVQTEERSTNKKNQKVTEKCVYKVEKINGNWKIISIETTVS
ncbi:hypothetical protein [Peribacillus alkalitolerans]|uniref:hypothetical protein n=1 Tax=Peribacillus alkalitolerans TaxID=1550385 RepID=UPI0013D818A5|nr:hypothetical protein [Peribacillus alkalitolerans]